VFLGSGQTVSPRTINLPAARGACGDDTPTILFTIDITTTESGGVVYTVQ
jgi:hypothetical protein